MTARVNVSGHKSQIALAAQSSQTGPADRSFSANIGMTPRCDPGPLLTLLVRPRNFNLGLVFRIKVRTYSNSLEVQNTSFYEVTRPEDQAPRGSTKIIHSREVFYRTLHHRSRDTGLSFRPC